MTRPNATNQHRNQRGDFTVVGPRYTIAQTRARVAALEIAADHLESLETHNAEEGDQYQDICDKLRNEATRLKAKAQAVRRGL